MQPTRVRAEFAELYAAGLFADRGWTVYFPRADKGFDFIATLPRGENMLVRPVQVKGVYPEKIKKGGKPFGRTLKLTAFHPQMVLVMPFFEYTPEKAASPTHVGFFAVKPLETEDGKHKFHPALLKGGKITIRKSYQTYFGNEGIEAVANQQWGKIAAPQA